MKNGKGISLFALTMIATGATIGSGIFIEPAEIASKVPDTTTMIGLWILGGLVSLIGALVFAEMGSRYPHAGGVYTYLSKAWGPIPGFLYGWCLLTVISSGTIAALCTFFAENLGYFISIPDDMKKYVAMLSIIALTLFNMFGIRLSEWFANIGTVLKILGIYGLILAAFILGDQSNTTATVVTEAITEPNYAGALVGVLWSYTGWHYASFVSGEAKNPARNIPLAMIFGTTLVTLTYVFCNLAYLHVFPHAELAAMAASGQNKLAAVEVMNVILPGMSWLMPALIGLSVFACAGLYILSTPRIFNQMSSEGLFFSIFAKNHPKFGVPVNAIMLQSFWAMLLVYIWGRFSSIVMYVTFIEWLFLLITCVGIFMIRKKESHLNAPFKVPFYPILPLIFIFIVGWFILQNAIADKPEYYAGLAVIPIGLVVYYIFRSKAKSKPLPL